MEENYPIDKIARVHMFVIISIQLNCLQMYGVDACPRKRYYWSVVINICSQQIIAATKTTFDQHQHMQNKRTGIEIFLMLAIFTIISRHRSSFCDISVKFTNEAAFLDAA